MMADSASIAMIGLGVMGEPIARNLTAKSGRAVRVHDIDPDAMARAAETGSIPCESIAEAARDCDVVFASLPSGKFVEDIARKPGGLLDTMAAGAVFVDLGTSPVALTRELATEFAAKGLAYLDAPVARTRQAAESGTLSVMVGGDEETFGKVRPLIACFATDITYCGGSGAGQGAKILNNMVLFQTVGALSEAYAIAVSAGFDPHVIFDALSKGSGDSFALRNHGVKAILPQVFPERAFSVAYARKDLSYAMELAEQSGIRVSGCRNMDALFDEAIRSGHSDEYFPVVSVLLSEKSET